MDALTFRTPKLLRKLTYTQGKDKQPILEIDIELVLKGLGLTYEQFVDLCILCGCDYCTTIRGIGPKTALKLIRQYKTIDAVLNVLRRDKKFKNDIPADWQPMKVPVEDPNVVETATVTAVEATPLDEAEAKMVEDELSALKDEHATGDEKPMTEEEVGDVPEIDIAEIKDDGDSGDAGAAENSPIILDEGEEGKFEIVPALYEQARRLFIDPEVQGTYYSFDGRV
jgi:5'-3' exonuclease